MWTSGCYANWYRKIKKRIMIKTFESYKKRYGVLMSYFNVDGWKEFIEELIDKDDIYTADDDDYGFEYNPHCTVLYGVHDYDGIIDDIHEFLPPHYDIYDIFRTNISIFENNEYDVVKFEIESDELKELNKLLSESFDNTNDYPDYHPHMTIAYVKKGTGKKYIDKLEPVRMKIDKYVYSDGEYKKTVIN